MERDLTRLRAAVVERVEEHSAAMVQLSREIHDHPELGHAEREASRLLAARLTEAGFQVERGVGGLPTALRAVYPGPERPAVAFVGEYDALPDLGHACGHNLIAAASWGAAVGLARATGGELGRVVFLGTPAEEGGGGKIQMVERGVFRHLDACLMFHPHRRNELEFQARAAYPLRIRFRGRAAHAASAPHEGINALEAVILTFLGINALRQHLREEARIHGIITKGGVAPNIVPEEAEARFLVRALTTPYLEEVLEKVRNCARGAAQATGAALELEPDGPVYQPMRNNQILLDVFRANLARAGWQEPEAPPRPGGSTDLGNVSQVVPCIQPQLAVAPEEVAPHTPQFAAAAVSPWAEEVLRTAAKALALTGLDVLADGALRHAARQELRGGT